MSVQLAGMSGMWTLIFAFFVVIPAIKWGVRGMGFGGRDGRRRLRDWADDWDSPHRSGGGGRVSRRDFDALRGELEERQGAIDQLHARVEELENRLDFTERLLANREMPSLTAPKAK